MSNPFAGLSSPQRLLIIAPDSFLAAVQPLVAHKNFTDIPTVAVTIASLKSYFGTGLSGQPSATDDAEVIKLGIQYAHENLETKYVLLVGDSQNLPVRYWFGVGWGPPSWTGTDTLIPANPNGGFIQSDLYYANLYHHKGVYPNLAANGFDTWDEGSPGLYNQCNIRTSPRLQARNTMGSPVFIWVGWFYSAILLCACRPLRQRSL
jgi:Peptidase family C25